MIRTYFSTTVVMLASLATGLGGCAGTKVVAGSISQTQAGMPRPHSISIDLVDATPAPHRAGRIEGHLHDVETATAELSRDLRAMLAARGLGVVDPDRPADLRLRCRLSEVRSGSTVARLLVGYGAGKAVLKLSAALSSEQPPRTLLSFATAGTTGAMPGAGLGIASAAGAAGTAIHMIGPVIGIPGTLRQGLAQESQQATTRIDEQLARYFIAQGWAYPRARPTRLAQFRSK